MRWSNRFSEYLFYLFFASLIFSNTLAQGFALILILFWIYKWISKRKFVKSSLDFPVIIYLFIRSISCFTSVDILLSLKELQTGIFFSLIYFAITNFHDDKNKDVLLIRYITIIIYAGAIASVYGITRVIVYNFAEKAQSTAGGITRFAEYTMIVFCLSFALADNRRIFPKKYIAFLVLGITTVGLIFAQERAQWLGIIPVIIIVGLKRKRWLFVYITTLIGVCIAFLQNIRDRFMTLTQPFSHTSGRFTIWEGARSLITRNPFLGFGPRTYSVVSPFLKDRGSWHSDYLQVYMESGIFGFASYIYLSIMLFKHCITIFRNRYWRDIGCAFFFALVAMYVASFFSGHTQEPIINPLFFSIIGFVSILSGRENEKKKKA